MLSSPVYRGLMTPDLAPGDPASPFDLPLLDPETHGPGGEHVRLADIAGERPVALVLARTPDRRSAASWGALEELHDRHGERVAFFIVYLREAHPEDGWALTVNRADGIAFVDPVTLGERAAVADACALRLQTRIPIGADEDDERQTLLRGAPIGNRLRRGRTASVGGDEQQTGGDAELVVAEGFRRALP